MDMQTFTAMPIFNLVILPLLIIISRIMDVSIGTLRIIFVSKGMRNLAPLLGFFEVLIWLLAISQIMQNLTNFINYVAYAMGFAIGNYIGIRLEEKIALGNVVMRIITQKDATDLAAFIKKSHYRWTILDGQGAEGTVKVLFTIIKRSDLLAVIDIVKKYNPNAVYSVEDVRSISAGYQFDTDPSLGRAWRFPILRKSK